MQVLIVEIMTCTILACIYVYAHTRVCLVGVGGWVGMWVCGCKHLYYTECAVCVGGGGSAFLRATPVSASTW